MITIKTEELVKALKPIVKVVRAKSTFPILSHVYISVAKGNMRLIGSDTETEIRNNIAVVADNAEFTVPALLLNDLCKSWPKGMDITIDLKGSAALVKCGRSRANLEVLPADDYPVRDCDKYQFVTVESKVFCNALAKARLGINKNHTNPSLRSVSLCFERDKLVVAGFCNEHHVAETIAIESDFESETLISDSGVDALLFCAAQYDEVEVGFSKSNVVIKAGGLFVATKAVDAKVVKLPPKFGNTDSRVCFSVDKSELLCVISRALIFCRSDSVIKKGTLTGVDGKIVVNAVNERGMEFKEEIECNMEEGFKVCFNLVAFEKIFSVSPVECEIFIVNEVGGVFWNADDSLALVAGIKN